MNGIDPRQRIDETAMSRSQIIAVAITVGLNVLDGFDVLAISFASPGIATEWGIDRAALGIVLAMELVGMAIGSVLLGQVTDRIGRRPMILLCLVTMTLGMAMTATADSIETLSAWRIFTGFGIGGMLAATNAAAAEFSNARSRSLCVSLMAIGYPVGAIIGGAITAQLLAIYDWRAVFYFGACATALFIPLVLWLLPETVPFLCQSRRPGALNRLNRALIRIGQPAADAMPSTVAQVRQNTTDIFRAPLVRTTIFLTTAYFMHIATFYFIIKWVPKIVTDMGFAASTAAGVLVWANVGGALGGATLGLLTRIVPLRTLAIFVLLMSTLMVAVFGRGQTDIATLSAIVGIAGFFTNAGVVALYAMLAQSFPTHARAAGTGFAIGVGRGGAALSPIIAGYLFSAGVSLQWVAIVMGAGALVAALALAVLRAPVIPEGAR